MFNVPIINTNPSTNFCQKELQQSEKVEVTKRKKHISTIGKKPQKLFLSPEVEALAAAAAWWHSERIVQHTYT